MKKFSLVKEDKDSTKSYKVTATVVFEINAKTEEEANKIVEAELDKLETEEYFIQETIEIEK
jgi:hypothetical protein